MKIHRHLSLTDKECILTIGNYDGIHLGHQLLIKRVLRESKNRGLDSAVLTFEPHPKEFFDPTNAPSRIISLREKLEFFKKNNIDRVYVIKFDQKFSALSAEEFLKILKNQIKVEGLVVGADFRFGKNRSGDINAFQEKKIQVFKPETLMLNSDRISSSLVRAAISNSNFKMVEKLLGRPYGISGKVTHGDKRGKTLGYPTANVHMFHKRPPLSGVFAVKLDGFYGMANLGIRPTFKGESKLQLEVHIFNFNETIYGKHVHVTFFHKIRDELKFSCSKELIDQISNDAKAAKSFFNI